MIHGKKIVVVLPAFNAAQTLAKTVGEIPMDVVDDIILVDDASDDNTVSVAESLGLKTFYHALNKGYGANQKTCYEQALLLKADIVVMLHADGQYEPEVLPDMLRPLVDDRADVVIGSRMMHRPGALRGGMPRYKYVGNIVLTNIQNTLTGMMLSEFHSGYRAYKTTFLSSVPFWENSDEWHFDTQILLQARQAGACVLEVPIPTYYGDEICHVNGILYGLHCVATSLFYWLHRLGIVYGRTYDVSLNGPRYTEKFGDPSSSHSLIWARLQGIPLSGARVLELGVGDASLTRRLADAGAGQSVRHTATGCARHGRGIARSVT